MQFIIGYLAKSALPEFRFDTKDWDFVIEDEVGMLRSAGSLGQLISAELDAGIPSERMILCGFSQGGAMSFLIGLTTTRRLGGIGVLSGWLPLKDKVRSVSFTSAEGSELWYIWL